MSTSTVTASSSQQQVKQSQLVQKMFVNGAGESFDIQLKAGPAGEDVGIENVGLPDFIGTTGAFNVGFDLLLLLFLSTDSSSSSGADVMFTSQSI